MQLMHGLDGGKVLGLNRLNSTAPFDDVATQAAQDAHIGVGIYKELDIAQVANFRLSENQDALKDDDGLGFNDKSLI